MKIGIGAAFAMAVVLHGALLAVLAVNVSLDKPKKPEEKSGQIIHATIVNMPPAKGKPEGTVEKPNRPQMQDTAEAAAEAAAKAAAEAEAKAKAELEKQVEAQKKAEAERQKALALKKKAEEEAKKKAEEEKRKAEEAKKKAEEEKRKAEEEKRKAEEAKRQAEAAKRAEEARRQAQEAANALEDDILGQINGVDGGVGLGSGNGSNDSLAYGAKVQQLIEQNWRIDPSMNGKRVVVTVSVNPDGTIYNEKCEGDAAVCGSAISTLRLIGLMPMPPKGCKDCNTIVITMTPKI